MTIRARLGKFPVNFGSAGGDIGGQALEGVKISEDEIITTWAGIAGAGFGVAACLPQASGVIRTEYPTEEDLKVGGARTNHARIISPRYEKVCIGIDDTDTKTEGATWVMALKCAEACRIAGVEFLDMRLVQLNPAVPNKIINCVSSALNFAVRPRKISELLEAVRTFVEKNSLSGQTGIACYHGISDFVDAPVAGLVKSEILTREQAESAADALGIEFLDSVKGKGRISALGAVVWGNRGMEAAGLYGEHL